MEAACFLAGPCQETGMVMVGQLVHADIGRRQRHGFLIPVKHSLPESVGVVIKVFPVLVVVLFHAGQEPGQGIHKAFVVHNGIPVAGAQPFLRFAVVFSQDNGLRIGFPDGLPEPLPEVMVEGGGMAQISCHIQPPSVRVVGRGDPFFPDGQNLLLQFLRGFVIQFGQGIDPPPAVIMPVVRPVLFQEIKIVMPGRVLRYIGSLFCFFPFFAGSGGFFINMLFIHPFVEGTAMVEDTIQDDPNPSGMRLTDQFGQQAVRSLQVGRVCRPGNISAGMDVPIVSFFQQGPRVPDDPAEMRVDMVIVLGVVFVIGRRDKEGIEINGLDTQVPQIIQLVHDPLQVTAVELPDVIGGRQLVPVLNTDHVAAAVVIFIRQDIIRPVSVAETVHEDLIHDAAGRPQGNLQARDDLKQVGRPGFAASVGVRHL